jgi:L-2,4-diaminobutyrate decarboxylase
MYHADFYSTHPEAQAAFAHAVQEAVETLRRALPASPYSGAAPRALEALLDGELLPPRGAPIAEVLERAETIVRHSVVVGHPATAAHLHCPPLIAALAAEVVLSALNQSMDSFDQAPAATIVELQVTDWLCRTAGLPASSGGTFTSGGTQSNYMGLWLTRDAWLARQGWSVRERGLPPDASRLAILCSEVAHFTVDKSAIQLGLGTNAVVKVPVDDGFRMEVDALHATIARLQAEGRIPFCIVGTAGTTDFGSIDPLGALADAAASMGAWLHVDAAFGGALLFSKRRETALAGLDRADSIALDLHKLLWQPISCGAFLLRDAAHYDLLTTYADYLNPESHATDGIPDLVNRSVLTTRRFDALKLWMTMRVLGGERLAAMIDDTCALAQEVARAVEARPALELVHRPDQLSCVLFRHRGNAHADETSARTSDARNTHIRDDLFARGIAVIGVTRVRGRVTLKLTILNPTATCAAFEEVLDAVVASGNAYVAPPPLPHTTGR